MEKEITANFTMEEPQRLEVTFEMTEGGKGTKDHSQLENRDLPDQHPISAITDLENTLAGKQANLSQAQIDATNSGITSSKVSIYDQYATSKQDKLSQAQQSAVDSGITSQKVATYDGYATSKQDKLSQGQQSAVDSGITSTKVGEYDNHIANKSNPHEVTKSQVGLGNADNTSDLDKPISTATQTALDGKVPVTRKVNDKALSADITLNATDVSALPNSTKYGASLSLTINSSTYVMTAQLKDQDGNDLGSAQTIDLPLESVVVSGSYDSQNKKVILTLQNGSTIEFSVADLVSGLQTEITSNNKLSADLVDDTSTTNKFVTTAEKDTWNAKQNALATQTAYTNKGSATKVPCITTNNLGQVTNITEVTITQPTVNNNTITITQGGTTKGSFTLNQNSDTTIALDAGGGSELPSQTGQAGKFLTTDGQQLSWAEVQSSTVYTQTIFEGNIGSTLNVSPLSLSNAVAIERNGQKIYESSGGETRDYTISGSVITFTLPLIATDRIAVISSNIAPIDLTPYILKSDLKFLNVVETGALTRNGAVYSGFGNSDYLRTGDVLDNTYLDLSITVKNFGNIVTTANTWEFVAKFKYKQYSAMQTLWGQDSDWGCNVGIDENGYLKWQFGNEADGSDVQYITDNETLIDNTDYFVKILFDGAKYEMFKSTNGTNWNSVGTITTTQKITRSDNWRLGSYQSNSDFYLRNTTLDIAGCYIKANGEYWWKGVETL